MPNTNEPNFPDIRIAQNEFIFFYYCKHTEEFLGSYPCRRIEVMQCRNCIGLNEEFLNDFYENGDCICGEMLSYGYYMFIYTLKKAGLLPKDFKTECCMCKDCGDDEK